MLLYSHCSFGGGSRERWWSDTVWLSSRAEFWLAAVRRFPVPGLSSICHSKPFRLFWWHRIRPSVTLQNLRHGFQAVEERGREKGEGRGRLTLGSNIPQEINGCCSSQIKVQVTVRTKDRKRHGKNMSVARTGDSIVLWHLAKSSFPTEKTFSTPVGSCQRIQ